MITKSKRIIWCGIVVLAILLVWLLAVWAKSTSFSKGNPAVKSIGQQGVFIGDKSKIFTEKTKQIDQEIDYVWEQIHMAGIAEKQGKLAEAAEYYRKGFHGLSDNMENIIPGRSMCATYLIDVYQKLGRYDEALAILDILEAKVFRGEFGIKRGTEIRTRLLAAKAKAGQR